MTPPTRIAPLAWVLGFLLALGGGPVRAQSPFPFLDASKKSAETPAATPGGQEESAPSPIEPFSLPQLSRAVEETSKTLRAAEKRMRADAVPKQAAAELDETSRVLATLEPLLDAAELSSQSFRSLDDRRQSWSRLDARLEAVEKTLENRATALDQDYVELRMLEDRWVATQENLAYLGLPSVVAERIDSVLGRLRSLQTPARETFAEILLLQDRAAEQRVRVSEALEIFDAALLGAQERVFAQRGRPFWKLFSGGAEGPGLLEDVRQTVRDKVGVIRDYFSVDRGSTSVLVLILALSLMVALWVRSRASVFAEGSPARRLVETRPIASAMLVGLVAWGFGQFNAPRPILELFVLALIVPLYRTLPIWLPSELRPSVKGLVGLVLVDRLRGLVSDESWAGRLGVLVLAVGGALLIVWTLRASGPWKELRARSRWIRSIVGIARVVAGALVVSTVANGIGQSGLAEVLVRGSLASLFLGAVLGTGVLVVETWLSLLNHADEAVGSEAERLRHLLGSLTRLAAITGWAFAILTVFGIGKTVIETVTKVVVTPWPIGSNSVSLANLLGFPAALIAGLTAARLLRLLLDQTVLPKFDLPRGVPAAVSTTVQYVVATLGVLLAIFALGIEASRFTILASAVGVGVGFGLQNIVNNFVSGLILLYERPIQTGDTIEIGALMGTVDRIGVRSSAVRTFDGAEVIVPNATLISNEVTNWTLSDRTRRVEVPVGVSYGSDPQRVIAVLEEAAGAEDAVLVTPAPVVLFQGFGDSSLNFVVRVWTSDFDDWLRLRSRLHVAIFAALAEAGIEIPFPQRDVHIKKPN